MTRRVHVPKQHLVLSNLHSVLASNIKFHKSKCTKHLRGVGIPVTCLVVPVQCSAVSRKVCYDGVIPAQHLEPCLACDTFSEEKQHHGFILWARARLSGMPTSEPKKLRDGPLSGLLRSPLQTAWIGLDSKSDSWSKPYSLISQCQPRSSFLFTKNILIFNTQSNGF